MVAREVARVGTSVVLEEKVELVVAVEEVVAVKVQPGEMAALVAAKLATVGTPILYMWAVDGLTEPDDTAIWYMVPVMLVIAYGL